MAPTATVPEEGAIRALLETVTDPEIPVLTIADLGILRDVAVDADGTVRVAITPTYTGCPATLPIELGIRDVLARAGVEKVEIETRLSPSWTTDWLSEAGREKMRAYGIAPPVPGTASGRGALFGADPDVACPHCGGKKTVKVNEFGSTACKALYRCEACLEPFDYFKCI